MGTDAVSEGSITLLGRDITHVAGATRREAGDRLRPQDRHEEGLAARTRRSGRTRRSAIRPAPLLEGTVDRPEGISQQNRGDPHRIQRRHPERRRRRSRVVGRQPAEAHHRSRNDSRSQGADRRPPDPRHRRRCAGGGLAVDPRRPLGGPGHVVDLGRPRRADRSLRHHPGDAAGSYRRPDSTRPRSRRAISVRT